MAGVIKKNFPHCRVLFLGRTYTKDIVRLCTHVDEFVNYDEIEKLSPNEQANVLHNLNADMMVHVFPCRKIAELARRARIALRVGTINRIYHWLNCNKLIKLSRKNSPYHESQLNVMLLKFLGINTKYSLSELQGFYGTGSPVKLSSSVLDLVDMKRKKVILHPKSKGSAKEWGLDNFEKLIKILPPEKYQVFISGTAQDATLMTDFIKKNPTAIDLTGKLSLSEFVSFINECDALIAASTGPLHIAAMLEKKAIGLFSGKRPIHPGRWAPLGKNAHALVFDENCENCRKKTDCDCITRITPETVKRVLDDDRV
jgi:heptosyltransferase-3